MSALPPAIFLMGPTAAGKTDLAFELTKVLPCELISVDSSRVYRGMDIGTAKPSKELLAEYPHRLIDIIEPNESYSAADFRTDALAAMDAGVTVIPVYNGDKHLHSATESSVMQWKTEATEHSDQPLRNYVYSGNVVRVVDTQGQVAAIEYLLAAIDSRCTGSI